jgi:3-hydroxyisobutyrate dehydrogenase-like beta-hydroxyacid dehydrogenase
MTVVGLLHPGEMGAAIGGLLHERGHEVRWASEGRSPDTVRRAARFADAGGVPALAAGVDVLLSVCPPHAALDVARSVAGFEGIYVDANAVSPDTVRAIAAALPEATVVDGGIVGPPPLEPGSTRIYLSGSAAAAVAGLFGGTAIEARGLGGELGSASALKACYAAWTKGTAALLLAIRDLAEHEGVDPELRAEWARSQPDVEGRLARAAESAAAKGWRWGGEMEEIGNAFAAAGLPPGFAHAAAEVYRSFQGS